MRVVSEKEYWVGKGTIVLQFKSKRNPLAIFQPRGLVWTHSHTNRKNQNKGVRPQKSPGGSRDISDGQGLGRWKEEQEMSCLGEGTE